jgi:hypothetical protein
LKKAINLIKLKNHLSPEVKLKRIKYYHEIKIAPSSKEFADYWLVGFIEGSFSISILSPR